MARNRIGREETNEKSKYPKPTPTETDDEKDDPLEITSIVEHLPSPAPVTPQPEITTIPTEIPTEISTPTSYLSSMSGPPDRPDDDAPKSDRSYNTGLPGPARGRDSDRGHPSSTSSTFITKTSGWGHNDMGTTTPPSPTPVQSDSTSSPEPTDDDFGLQNNGTDNSPNKTPIYAAAGIVPVVVIIIAFFAFFCLRKRRRQKQTTAGHGHIQEMKMQPRPIERPYIAPITPPSPPPQAVLPQYSPSTPSSSHPPTASSSQPVILGPIPSGNNGAYLTGMDTSDLVSMRSGGVSRQGTIVDRDPFADGRSLEEAPPPYRPSSLPPASLVSTSRNSSVRLATPPHTTSRTQLIERSPFDDPDDDEISDISGPTLGRDTDVMSDVSDISYQIDPVVGRAPF
ncbi:uncharacterized protein M421DRAFT_422036 [Didymella exigua CBS 183.55]|uniref:Mid2 domain-containing protein n=1 Tax=Didymella exigua CBS 183.55 TaxID=1150837 RepID=A0A6A5RHC7_9PLEO|nr:uncharacterized protein M421DRAFT_422036 [Didymella exigua CBS 183.55]KAF1927172.1 hypothetical protein M421DRAFT_422036 [Didymella exigua CBS 183.55]